VGKVVRSLLIGLLWLLLLHISSSGLYILIVLWPPRELTDGELRERKDSEHSRMLRVLTVKLGRKEYGIL
jgi:hypothetical protein